MDVRLQEAVRQRAQDRCEYCQFPARFARVPFQIDHIVAEKHGGPTTLENLALSPAAFATLTKARTSLVSTRRRENWSVCSIPGATSGVTTSAGMEWYWRE